MKAWLFIVLILIASGVNAGEVYPNGCKPFVISKNEENVILKTSKPSLLLLHNITNMDLFVTHPVDEPSASAGWITEIEKDNWSALFLTEKEFILGCTEHSPGHEQQVACVDVLAICSWKNIVLGENEDELNNSFWAGENMKLEALKAYLARRGFII